MVQNGPHVPSTICLVSNRKLCDDSDWWVVSAWDVCGGREKERGQGSEAKQEHPYFSHPHHILPSAPQTHHLK